ncbi:KIAA1430-like protein-domain-containing protein [Geranomyces variabilis]|nr:KIAA1430-like protein-domain-containing protein [Geranomyces variabilis]
MWWLKNIQLVSIIGESKSSRHRLSDFSTEKTNFMPNSPKNTSHGAVPADRPPSKRPTSAAQSTTTVASSSLATRPEFAVDINREARSKYSKNHPDNIAYRYIEGPIGKPLPPPTPATAHRRYTPVYKCSNRLLAKKWDDVAAQRHREKIASMKPAIDNKPPRKCSHLDMGLKKLRQEQEKSHRIQEENIILLNRMARQLQSPVGFTNVDSAYRVKAPPRKLNPQTRARERHAHEIDHENQLLVDRIQRSAPVYSREAWSEDRRRNLGYIANHSRYPEAYHEEFEREGVQLPYNQAIYVHHSGKRGGSSHRPEETREFLVDDDDNYELSSDDGDEDERARHVEVEAADESDSESRPAPSDTERTEASDAHDSGEARNAKQPLRGAWTDNDHEENARDDKPTPNRRPQSASPTRAAQMRPTAVESARAVVPTAYNTYRRSPEPRGKISGGKWSKSLRPALPTASS